MDDLVFQFNKLEYAIQANKVTFLPNQIVKMRNFRGGYGISQAAMQTQNNTNSDNANAPNDMPAALVQDNLFINCSMSFEDVRYLKGYPGEFNEKIYMVIPTCKVPELVDNTSLALNHGQSINQNV